MSRTESGSFSRTNHLMIFIHIIFGWDMKSTEIMFSSLITYIWKVLGKSKVDSMYLWL